MLTTIDMLFTSDPNVSAQLEAIRAEKLAQLAQLKSAVALDDAALGKWMVTQWYTQKFKSGYAALPRKWQNRVRERTARLPMERVLEPDAAKIARFREGLRTQIAELEKGL